jgi:hypothetical protein
MSFLIIYNDLLFITGKDNLFPLPGDLDPDPRLVKFRIECGFGSFQKKIMNPTGSGSVIRFTGEITCKANLLIMSLQVYSNLKCCWLHSFPRWGISLPAAAIKVNKTSCGTDNR